MVLYFINAVIKIVVILHSTMKAEHHINVGLRTSGGQLVQSLFQPGQSLALDESSGMTSIWLSL